MWLGLEFYGAPKYCCKMIFIVWAVSAHYGQGREARGAFVRIPAAKRRPDWEPWPSLAHGLMNYYGLRNNKGAQRARSPFWRSEPVGSEEENKFRDGIGTNRSGGVAGEAGGGNQIRVERRRLGWAPGRERGGGRREERKNAPASEGHLKSGGGYLRAIVCAARPHPPARAQSMSETRPASRPAVIAIKWPLQAPLPPAPVRFFWRDNQAGLMRPGRGRDPACVTA